MTATLLSLGLKNPNLGDKSISYLWKLGFGAVTSESLINIPLPGGPDGIIAPVLLANAPQVVLSFLFVTYNGLFSSMLLMKEWSGFAYQRKPLRVTSPTGTQRSSYWLQLPYRYGIPLLVMSGGLHWFVSQSIFLARVSWPKAESKARSNSSSVISVCGYSNIAIISVIILGSIIVLLGILAGFRKYKAGMPLVGTCSAAISAACHSLQNDPNASLLPLMWGAVKTEEGLVKHCCFSSLDVSPPVEGEVYAGLEKIDNLDPPQDSTEQLIHRVVGGQRKRFKLGCFILDGNKSDFRRALRFSF